MKFQQDLMALAWVWERKIKDNSEDEKDRRGEKIWQEVKYEGEETMERRPDLIWGMLI